MENMGGRALQYSRHFVPITGDEIDLRQLFRAGLVEYQRSGSILRGAPTEKGINVVATIKVNIVSEERSAAATNSTGPLASSQLLFDLFHFKYQYPDDFDAIDQQASEDVRSRANAKVAAKTIGSYDELSTIKMEWLTELTSGVARVLGLVATRQEWTANQRRQVLQDYVTQAAKAACVTRPALGALLDSKEYKELDTALFPSTFRQRESRTPQKIANRPSTQSRLAARLKRLKHESKLTWETIAKESHVSKRWLLAIAAGGSPSKETRTAIRDYFARILNRSVRF